VGYVGHETGLYDDLTVQDNLSFRAAAFGTTKQHVEDICDTVGLDTRLLSVPAKGLSAGQRKKVALVGLALSASPLWLLDEPHASLDAASADGCDALLTAARKNGTTIIFASHELDRSARLATRSVLVDEGLVSPC
jgi:heme exporter protein A